MPAADDHSPVDCDGRVPHAYRIDGGSATQSLRELVVAEIRDTGPMRLPRYLELALYHPEWGYYARGQDRVGKDGDFFTSVSVGPLFGELLAHRFLREYVRLGRPDAWRLVEFGANDAKLAVDVLESIRRVCPEAFRTLEYVVCEPLPTMRERQKTALAGYPARVIGSPDELDGSKLPGMVFGNEVLDALPFHWVERRDGGWRERVIDVAESGVLHAVCEGSPSREVLKFLESLPHMGAYPDGWQGEVRVCWTDFLRSAMHCVDNPLMIWVDYGMERGELLHPSRSEGTWRAYRNHRVEAEPWNDPGDCDLTAHVDFTGVAEAVGSLGGRVASLVSQGSWLTHLASEELAAREGRVDPEWVRQFQTLTHPAHMGGKFQVMECVWEGLDPLLP